MVDHLLYALGGLEAEKCNVWVLTRSINKAKFAGLSWGFYSDRPTMHRF